MRTPRIVLAALSLTLAVSLATSATSGAATTQLPLQLKASTAENPNPKPNGPPSAFITGYSFGYPDPGGTVTYSQEPNVGTFSFPVPTRIEPGGTSFTMSITGKGNNFAPTMGASGSLVQGGPVQIGTHWLGPEIPGGTVTGAVNLKPDGSTNPTLTIGVNFGPAFVYMYEQVTCGDASRSRRGREGRAVNEVRIVAFAPGVAVHKVGCPETHWIDAEKDMVLQQGDEISIDPDGSATLQFADMSTVVVRDTTQLKIASFFTEGGVTKTEILLKMGQVRNAVRSHVVERDSTRIVTPTSVASVRGTTFTVAYDPGTKATLTSVSEGTVEVDPVGAGLPTRMVGAGKEVEVLQRSITRAVRVGTAGARNGVTRFKALDRVMAVVARNDEKCRTFVARLNATGVRPIAGGWAVTVKLVDSPVKGITAWTVKGRTLTPTNALAMRVSKGCPPLRR